HYREALYFANNFPLEVDIGKMEIEYRHCGALHFPKELKLLFLRKHPLSQTFHQNIHNYNTQPNTGDILVFGQLYFLNTADAHKHQKKEFAQWLFQLGNSTLPTTSDEIEIPTQCISTNDLITDVFDDALNNNNEMPLYLYLSIDEAIYNQNEDPTQFPEDHGQLYVAFSRAKGLSSIKVKLPP
ncbi:29091_t:CDS:2, partial [Gigaspora margarita]